MAQGIQAWSLTASANGNADANVNFSEGQSPPSLNNSSRALMSALRAFYNALGGGITYGGSSNAYTATNDSPGAWSAYAEGQIIGLEANHTNTGAATINVDGLGAKTIKKSASTDVDAGDIVSGAFYLLRYNGTHFQLVSGEAFQPLDAQLTALAGLSPTSGDVFYWTGATSLSAIATTAIGRGLLSATDPNADRILFFDDSAGVFDYLVHSSDFAISGTSLSLNMATAHEWTGAQTFTSSGAQTTFRTNSTNAKIIFNHNGTLRGYAGANASYCFFAIDSANTILALSVDNSGNTVAAGTVTGSSDRKFKTDIADLTLEWAAAFIDSLRPRSFLKRGVALVGFVAQEIPDARYVFAPPDDPDMDPDQVGLSIPAGAEWMAPMVLLIRDLRARVAELEARLA